MEALHPLAPDPHTGDDEISLDAVVSEQQRVVRSAPPGADDVAGTSEGVARLLAAGNHRAAASLASQLLATQAAGLSAAEKVALRTQRAVALAAAGMLAEAAAEVDTLLPNATTAATADADEEGAPFLLRFAKAMLPSMQRSARSPAALYDLLAWIERREQRATTTAAGDDDVQQQQRRLWSARACTVLGAIAGRHATAGEYDLAIEAVERIVVRRPSDPRALSELGRLYISAGGLQHATTFFREAERFLPGGPHDPLALANAALLRMAREEFSPAIELLSLARSQDGSQDLANNIAVAWVYSGNLGRGLAGLREAISRDPCAPNADVVVANLSILYDLTSELAEQKKRELTAFVHKHQQV